MVCVSKELELLTQKIEIMPGNISDHSPILWQMKDNPKLVKRWIINKDILNKQEIVESLRKDIQDNFDMNLTPGMNLAMVWDAFKVVIRGRLINWNSIEKTRCNERLNQVQNEIK